MYYQAYSALDVNFSAGLEIADRRPPGESRPVAGELDLALIRDSEHAVWILESFVEISHEEQPWFLSPGVIWKTCCDGEIAIGAPIGLNSDAPKIGMALLATWEFGGDDESGDDEDAEEPGSDDE